MPPGDCSPAGSAWAGRHQDSFVCSCRVRACRRFREPHVVVGQVPATTSGRATGVKIDCESLPCPCSSASGGDNSGGRRAATTRRAARARPGCSGWRSARRSTPTSARTSGRPFARAGRGAWGSTGPAPTRVATGCWRTIRRGPVSTATSTRRPSGGGEAPAWSAAATRAAKAEVRYVPSSENRSHGASLGAKLQNFCNGTRFRYVFGTRPTPGWSTFNRRKWSTFRPALTSAGWRATRAASSARSVRTCIRAHRIRSSTALGACRTLVGHRARLDELRPRRRRHPQRHRADRRGKVLNARSIAARRQPCVAGGGVAAGEPRSARGASGACARGDRTLQAHLPPGGRARCSRASGCSPAACPERCCARQRRIASTSRSRASQAQARGCPCSAPASRGYVHWWRSPRTGRSHWDAALPPTPLLWPVRRPRRATRRGAAARPARRRGARPRRRPPGAARRSPRRGAAGPPSAHPVIENRRCPAPDHSPVAGTLPPTG